MTDAALLALFASNQHLLVPAIWKAIEGAGGQKLVQEIVGQVSRTMADHYLRRITAETPVERLRQFVALLQADGAMVDIAKNNGQLVIQKRSCLFLPLADERQACCNIDLEMMSKVVGCPVRRIARRDDGAPCCIFEIDPDE